MDTLSERDVLNLQELTGKIVDAIEENTDKLQEVLERLECIDNTLDDMKDDGAVVERLDRISQQLG